MLTEERNFYKPFEYPWAFDVYKKQNRMHWLPEEATIADDIRDYNEKLEVGEKHTLTFIFRFFTQQDVNVASGYADLFIPYFKPPEIRQALFSIANMEGTHMDAYNLLIEQLGLPESDHKAFLEIDSMMAKHEYLNNFNMDTPFEVAKSLAIYSALTEGVQLFSSFAILLNFPRFNLMKGMGQIVTWSVKDESLHVDFMARLTRTYFAENPGLLDDKLKSAIYSAAERSVELEDNFIDTCFGDYQIRGITASETKIYIRYIANKRLQAIGLKGIFAGFTENPFPWLEELLNSVEHTNFFENRSTEYAKAATTGNWQDIFK